MKIDKMKWNRRRLEIEAQIRAEKTWIRDGGSRQLQVRNWQTGRDELKQVARGPGLPIQTDYDRLESLKLEATMLYTLRASLRGHQHRLRIVKTAPDGAQTWEYITKEQEASIAESWVPYFQQEAAPEVAQAGT